MKKIALLLTIVSTLYIDFAAAAPSELKFDYPELMVVPRASKRIQMEAVREKDNKMTGLLPMQISALSTFVSGIAQFANIDHESDDKKGSAYTGAFVGAAWLGATFWLNHGYKVYGRTYRKIKAMPAKTKRQLLVRERLAEEHLRRIKSLGNTLRWTSFITNAGASAYMLGNLKSDTMGVLFPALSMLLSFTPIIFQHDWVTPANEQERYKKKIYSPIAINGIVPTPEGGIAPGLTLSWTY